MSRREQTTLRVKQTRWERFGGDEELEARHLGSLLGVPPDDVRGWEIVMFRGGGVFVRVLFDAPRHSAPAPPPPADDEPPARPKWWQRLASATAEVDTFDAEVNDAGPSET